MSIEKIKPGRLVQVNVLKTPRRGSAVLTLVRLLSKDPGVVAYGRLQRKIRRKTQRPTKRGGRIWMVRRVKQRCVHGRRGESGTIRATADVLNDLRSVAPFVEVTKA